MARRTLTSTWKNFERLNRQYEKSEGTDQKKVEAINELVDKVNTSRITNALETLFVHPYGLDEYQLKFTGINGHGPLEWITNTDEEEKLIFINVVGVFDFAAECNQAIENLKMPESRKSFLQYRYQAYLAELSKLPSRYHLFLMILREAARIKHITEVEKKGGEIEIPEGKAYLQLLWAFKELEAFIRRTNGIDLRAEHRILWLESDWFVGR